MFSNTRQRYRFFIERWGQKGLRDQRWNRWGPGREGAILKLGVRGLSQSFRGDFVILWADKKNKKAQNDK